MTRAAAAPRAARPSFVAFLEQTLRVKLSPGQRVLWSVIADRAQPQSFVGADRELARTLFGDVDEIPKELLSVVAVVKGARIGGTYLAALRLIFLALTVPLKLAPGETAFGVVVAPDLRLARQALRYVTGAFDAAPELAQRKVKQSEDSVTVRRDDGQQVTIECLPATRGGSALRGRTLVGVLLDEAAFFRDESSVVNDVEVYKAVVARVVPGGQCIVSSTPWAEMGLLYDLFQANHGNPKSCVAVHAPTTVMRSDTRSILSMVRRETERDPETAEREYGAAFMTRGAGLFFDGAAIDAAIDSTLVLPRGRCSRTAAAVDPGFARDSSTFVAVGVENGVFAPLLIDEMRPAKGAPLQPSVVVGRWAELAKQLGLASLRSDVHYRETVREHLTTHQLQLEPIPEGQPGKRAMFESTRTLLNEGKLRLPNHPRLLKQMREVVSKPTAGGGIAISQPRRGGSHGDLVSAFVAAVHALHVDGGIDDWIAAANVKFW